MTNPAIFGARARISLAAIRRNLLALRQRALGTRCMAVVKANAYGHGLVDVARALADVECFAVARFPEAERLREAGVTAGITVLGGPLAPSDLDRARHLDCAVAVHDPAQLAWVERYGARLPGIWIKVDTGMRRLGFYPDAVRDVVERLAGWSDSPGLMTHFANADDPADDTTRQQLARFRPLLDGFEGQVSISNSAAVLSWETLLEGLSDVRDDGRLWIRPGLALYGLSPFSGSTGRDLGLEPAMRFESVLVSVKALGKGDRVGYGGDWRAPDETLLGIVAAGYGDGYPRHVPSGSPVLVNGRRVPVAGRISMDLLAVDLGRDAKEQPGDPVLLWGGELPAEEIARCAGTIPYQLVTGVTHREPPVYVD